MASYPRSLPELADPLRFPALTRFIAAGVFEAEDGPDDEFIFGLDRILDGVAVLIGAGGSRQAENKSAVTSARCPARPLRGRGPASRVVRAAGWSRSARAGA